jgi:hypothetical protein
LRPNPRLERTAPGQPAQLFKWFAKAHAYVFYALRSTAKSAWNDGLEDWKALAVMSLAMGFASLTFVCMVSIIIRHRVFLPNAKPPFVALWSIVMIGFLVFNHYSLVFENKWSRFKSEFQHQSEVTRTIGFISVWVSVVLMVLAAEWAGSIAIKLPAT